MDEITLKLSEQKYPTVLRQYGLEGAKRVAIDMALAQYKARPVTEAMLYSCLSTLESDLERMFPPPKTPEERAEAAAEEAEEERLYQEAIAEMKPFMMNGKQLLVNENGDWGVNRYGEPIEGAIYPVWVEKNGRLTARIYLEGWDWLLLEDPNEEDEEYEEYD